MAKLASTTNNETTDFSHFERVALNGKSIGHIFTFNEKVEGEYKFDLGNPFADKKGTQVYWAYQNGDTQNAVGWLYLKDITVAQFRTQRKKGNIVIGISRNWEDLE